MTVQDIANKVLALIDNYTEDGVPVSADDNADVLQKIILFTDSAQKENWKRSKVTSQIEITNKPPENRLTHTDTIEDFEGNTQYYPNEDGVNDVQGYSIQVNAEASDNAVITFQELVGGTWTTLATVSPTGIDTLTTYKGVLSVSSTSNPVRIKVDGTYHFLHQNRALWKNLYKSASVPTYEPWVKYDLPTDFNYLDQIVEEFPIAQYAQTQNWKIENYRDFYYSFDYEGSIRITYKPIPTTITALTDTIQIDDILAENIVLDIVAKLGFYENPDLVNWAEGRRLEAKTDADLSEAPSTEVMVDYYNYNSGFYR